MLLAILQTNVDLFASQTAPSPAVSTTIDFFAAPDPPSQIDSNFSKSNATVNIVNPFAGVPLNNFEGSDPFGAFTSHTDSLSTVSIQNSTNDGGHGNIKGPSTETKLLPMKDTRIYSKLNLGIFLDLGEGFRFGGRDELTAAGLVGAAAVALVGAEKSRKKRK